LPDNLVQGVELQNGVLKFKTLDQLKSVIAVLEEESVNLYTTFKEKHKDLNEEELFNAMEEENFNSQEVYESFENYFGFKSLRTKISEEETIWLNNEELDMDKNPNNHFIVGDAERTVLSCNCDLMVGNSIYLVQKDFSIIEITNGDFSTLQKILNKNKESLKNVVYHTQYQISENNKGLWRYNADESGTYKTGDYKMEYRVTITNGIWWHFVKATTDSYYKKGWSWKKRYTTVSAAFGGTVWNGDGVELVRAAGDETTYGSTSTTKSDYGVSIKTKKNQILSSHYVNSVSTKDLSLTW